MPQTLYDISDKKILQLTLQMELDILDKKIARVLTARDELHKAVCELVDSADGLTSFKSVPKEQPESTVTVKLDTGELNAQIDTLENLCKTISDSVS